MVIFQLSTSRRWCRAVSGLLALWVAGTWTACTPLMHPTGSALHRVATLPAFRDDADRESLTAAVRESLRYFERLPDDRSVTFGSAAIPARAMRGAMADLLALLATKPAPEALAAELDRRFVAFRAAAPAGVLFTGYYLPTLAARATREARFRVPVLGRPPDLVTVALGDLGAPCACREQLAGRVVGGALKPYSTRAEIEAAATPGAPVIAWVEDAVGLFFLQVQGSGVLSFPDERTKTIGFAASNGHPYVGIGRLLVERGALTLEQASMPGIRQWIAAHPTEGEQLLRENPRYVFFRELGGPPLGSLGTAVTAGRTIAVDPAVFPAGALGFMQVPPAGGRPGFSRLVLSQDAGAAIRGPGRVDVYLGAGAAAETVAGELRSPGDLYFLAPRTAVEP